MDVEKHLTRIYDKINNKTQTKKDRAVLVFFELFFHKRCSVHLEKYLKQDFDKRIEDGLKKIAENNKIPIPKFKSGDEVYLILKDHDNKPYTINSIHVHRDRLIGYTFLNQDKVASGHIYPEALFVHRNIGRLDSDNTSYEKFISDLKSKYESWA